MSLLDCVLLGAGGHARVLVDCLRESTLFRIRSILNADPASWNTLFEGILIAGGDDLLEKLIDQGVTHFVIGVGSISSNTLRQKLFTRCLNAKLKPLTIRHSSVICSNSAHIGDGAQMLPGCIINASAKIGLNVIINTGAIVEHDCAIGDHAYIAPRATLGGQVIVESGAYVGLGACVLQGRRIGHNSVVGAGAVVVRDVPPQTVVIGVPAKELRKL